MERDSNKTLFGKYAPTYLADIDNLPPAEREAWLADLLKDPDAKTPRTLVRNILHNALVGLGGTRWAMWFATQSDANARVFFQGITKMMPTELSGPGGSPLQIIIRREHDEGPHDVQGALIDGVFVKNPDAPERLTAQPALEPVS